MRGKGKRKLALLFKMKALFRLRIKASLLCLAGEGKDTIQSPFVPSVHCKTKFGTRLIEVKMERTPVVDCLSGPWNQVISGSLLKHVAACFYSSERRQSERRAIVEDRVRGGANICCPCAHNLYCALY
jgi:hypothetical protein